MKSYLKSVLRIFIGGIYFFILCFWCFGIPVFLCAAEDNNLWYLALYIPAPFVVPFTDNIKDFLFETKN